MTVAGEHVRRRLASSFGLAALLVSAVPAHAASGEGARMDVLIAGIVAILSALMLLRQWRRRIAAEKAERASAAEAAALRATVAAAEAAAREAAPFAAILRILPIALWSRRPDLSIATENPAAQELFLLAGGDQSTELSARAHRLQRPQSESRAIIRNGQRRLFEFAEIPVSGGGTVGHAADVTSLEQSQAELARHLAAHADVLELLGTAVAVIGPDLRLKFFNTAYARLFQFDPRWLAGEPALGEMLEQLRERHKLPETADFRADKQERLREITGIIEPQESLMHLPDGSTLRSTIAPHPLGGAILAYEDVTDRLVLERSYNTLIEVQRETLDNLQEAIAVFGGDGRLKLRNPAFARLWNIAPDALPAERHIGEVVELMRPLLPVEADWPAFKASMIADVFERTPQSGRLERADGRIVDFANVPLPDGATQIVYVDATDRVRVEQALRERNQALEAADQLKSEFIANVSYELRTPLNAIIGFSEILAKAYFGPLNERQSEYARGILESSNRLVTLINNILDLATIEAGYMRLERGTVEVAGLVEEIAALSRERARSVGINLEASCAADLGSANLDHRRVRQALFNVVSNAIKYSQPGDTVTIAARRQADTIEFAVSDTGIGIPPVDHARVFKKFERGTIPGTSTGLGLGLSLVKSFVELHGGTVTLESAPAMGTTVTCRIPIAPVPEPAPAPAGGA